MHTTARHRALTRLAATLLTTLTTTSLIAATAHALPDNRNYELVSPPNKNGAEIAVGEGRPEQSAPSGLTITYGSTGAFENSVSGGVGNNQYLATREPTATGWHSRNIDVHQASIYAAFKNFEPLQGFSEDLTIGALLDSDRNDPPLAPGAIPGVSNFYLEDLESGALQALTTVAPHLETVTSSIGYNPTFVGGSPDFAHVVFTANDKLTENALYGGPTASNLYEWSTNGLTLVNVRPDGEPTLESLLGGVAGTNAYTRYDGEVRHAVSDDGSRVFWTAGYHAPGEIFMREVRDGTNRTLAVSASQKTNGSGIGGHDPNGPAPAFFHLASANGERAIFTSCEQLTDASTAVSDPNTECSPAAELSKIGNDLYSYNVRTEMLSDLTPDSQDPVGAQVEGVLGADEEATYIYFLANGVLAPGATLGDYDKVLPGTGEVNLYVWHEGNTTFIAHLAPHTGEQTASLAGAPLERPAYVTPDGRYLAYAAEGQVYLYDALTSQPPTCVSCGPGGAPSQGVSTIVPWGTENYDPRSVSSDGTRVFFNSTAALVPGDTNNAQDAYEWERDGTGSCQQAAGCQYLLSSGTSQAESSFVDASPSGDDAFLLTRDALVPQDIDPIYDLYDARVGAPPPPPLIPPPSCEGEACKAPPTPPPPIAVPLSTQYEGVTNPVQKTTVVKCKKSQKLQHGRCTNNKMPKPKTTKRRGATKHKAHKTRVSENTTKH